MNRDIKLIVGIFTASGIVHLVRPQVFEPIVPKPLPKKREIVYASGVAELACAALVLHPRTRRVGGLASAAVLVGVYPANVQMTLSAFRSSKAPGWYKAGLLARLPLQYPPIAAAFRISKTAGP